MARKAAVKMFPDTDDLPSIVLQTENVLFRRRLVDRVQRVWSQAARSGRFPRRGQIEPSMLGEDWINSCVIAVRSPVHLSHFVAIGDNLSFVHCPSDSLAGVLLSHLPDVLAERRCLMIEGRATLRGAGVLYRSACFLFRRTASRLIMCSARRITASCAKMKN